MKKNLLLIALETLCGVLIGNFSQAQNTPPPAYTGTAVNYIRSWEATAPGQTSSSLLTGPLTDVKQTTQYYDGFGRPMQTVLKQASPLGNDLVTPSTYDSWGREVFTYLSFVSNAARGGDITNDGKFKADAFQQQVACYNTLLQGQPGETNLGAGNLNWAYSQTNFELSPINRVLNTYAPGANWVGSQSAGTPHNLQAQSLVNTSTDNVQMWNIAVAQGSIPTSGGAYGPGQLYKSIAVDEQGHQGISYMDMYGQVVLKKRQNTAAADNGTGSAHSGWLCTYYVYDDYHNLRFIIPPVVVQQIDGTWSISQPLADELCYRFEYDLLNRAVIKKTPGTPTGSQGEVWMVYDVRNRLVMTQDGNMRANSRWLCFLYDALDRQVMTGTITSTNNLSQMQASVTGQTGSNSSGTVTGATPSSLQGNLVLSAMSMSGNWQASQSITLNPGFNTLTGGSFSASIVAQSATPVTNTVVLNNNPLPTAATLSPLTASFYDNYNFLSTSGTSLSATLNQTYTSNGNYFITGYYSSPTYAAPVAQANLIQGQPTGSMVLELGGSALSLYSLNIYDDHDRVIQAQAANITGGTDIATSQYSWSGQTLRTLVTHNKNGTNAQSHLVSTAMNYDPMGRLLTITKTVNSTVAGSNVSTPTITVITNQYDELGRPKQKTLGNNMETLLHEYNARGYLLGVNRAYAKTTSSSSNYFGFDLGYDQGTITDNTGTSIGSYATPAFNGNIAGTVWKSRGDNQVRKYDYSYDVPNRLLAADFNQQTGGQFNKTANIDFSVSNLTYDANGNIGRMNQNGWLLGGFQQIDQLVYTYQNSNVSNRLLNVVDNSGYNASSSNATLGDFHYSGTKASNAVDYGYDNNANVTSDANRGLTTIAYNYRNLPQTLTFANNKGTIQYIYDAAGNKLQKITTETNASVNYNGTNYTTQAITTTTYINGFVYKSLAYNNVALASLQYTDKLQLIGDEVGRIRGLYANASSPAVLTGYAFDYFIKDHLGNVRMVLTDEQQQDVYPAATIEPSTIATEQTYYSITNDAAHVIPVSSLTWWGAATGSSYQDNNGISNPGNPNPTATSAQVYKLNGNTGDKFGLGITLKVMAGDQVSIYAKSVWHNTGATPGSYPVSSVLSTFLSAFAGTSAVVNGGHGLITGGTLNTTSATTAPLTSLLNNTPTQSNPTVAPKAAINWILFNDQFVPVSVGTDLVSSTGDVLKSHAQLNLPMAANGYLYVYCSNESAIDVYFDNLQVVNTRGPILEETHYYPYGLAMAGISDRAWNKLQNFYHYQGKEMQDQEFSDGTGLAEYDFKARFYDHQLGRWHNQDPSGQYASPYLAMGNNWPNGTDPNGKDFLNTLGTIGLIVGSAVAAYFTAGLSFDLEGQLIFGGAVLVGGYIGASEISGGHYNPGKWNGNAWKGAITGELIGASAAIGAEYTIGEFADLTTPELSSIASIETGGATGIAQNIAMAYANSAVTSWNHQPSWNWGDMFLAATTGAISGVAQSPGMQKIVDQKIWGGVATKEFQGVTSNVLGGILTTTINDAYNRGVKGIFDISDQWPAAFGNAVGQMAHQSFGDDRYPVSFAKWIGGDLTKRIAANYANAFSQQALASVQPFDFTNIFDNSFWNTSQGYLMDTWFGDVY